MSRVRILAGSGLLVVAGAAWLASSAVSLSESAVVSAPVDRVTAPLSGTFALGLAQQPGDRIRPGFLVARFAADRPIDSHLREIEMHRRRLEGALRAAAARAEALAREAAAAEAAAERHRAAAKARVVVRLREARATRDGRAAEFRLMEANASRVARLGTQSASQARIDEAEAARDSAHAALALAAAELVGLEREAAALEEDVWIASSDGAPWPVRVAAERAREARLAAIEREAIETELAAVAAQAAEERRAVERAGTADHIARSESVLLWFEPSGRATEGAAVAEIADCRRRFVLAALPAADYSRLDFDDVVRVRLLGRKRLHEARSWRMLGGRATVEELGFASMPEAADDAGYVWIELPEAALARNDDAHLCGIGRSAEVVVDHADGALGALTETLAARAAQRVRILAYAFSEKLRMAADGLSAGDETGGAAPDEAPPPRRIATGGA